MTETENTRSRREAGSSCLTPEANSDGDGA
jgi:hypothetical protein